MKIAICLKTVPDIKIGVDPTNVEVLKSVKHTLNPYDEYALEEALILKDKDPSIEVYTLTIGNNLSVEPIRNALAKGADKAFLIEYPTTEYDDSLAIAKSLAEVIEEKDFQVVFMGKESSDNQNGLVPIMLGKQLCYEFVTNIKQVEFSENTFNVHKVCDNGVVEIHALQIPCIIGFARTNHMPRYTNVMNIMKAKNKEIINKQYTNIGSGHVKFRTVVEKPKSSACLIIENDSIQDSCDTLIELLHTKENISI